MQRRFRWGALGVVIAASACGSAPGDGGLFGPSGGGGSGAGSSGASGGVSGSAEGASGGVAARGGVGAGGTGGSSGGTTGDGGAPGGGAPGGGAPGGGAPGGGGTSSGGTSAGGTGPAGGAGGVGTGPCAGATCAFVAGDACCVGDGISPYCSNEKLANPCECKGVVCHKLEIFCDGPEDCPAGHVCCAMTGFLGSKYDVVECSETCKSDPIGSTRREVCHPAGKPCVNATACLADPKLPPGYATCQP